MHDLSSQWPCREELQNPFGSDTQPDSSPKRDQKPDLRSVYLDRYSSYLQANTKYYVDPINIHPPSANGPITLSLLVNCVVKAHPSIYIKQATTTPPNVVIPIAMRLFAAPRKELGDGAGVLVDV